MAPIVAALLVRSRQNKLAGPAMLRQIFRCATQPGGRASQPMWVTGKQNLFIHFILRNITLLLRDEPEQLTSLPRPTPVSTQNLASIASQWGAGTGTLPPQPRQRSNHPLS